MTWLGHVTILIELGGARLLTSPVMRQRVAHLRRLDHFHPTVRSAVEACLRAQETQPA